MNLKRLTFFLCVTLVCSGFLFLFPQNEDKLKSINQDIKAISEKLDILKKDENSILNDIYRIELEYDKARIENNKLKLQLNDAQIALDKKNAEKNQLETKIDNSKQNLKKILRILYKIGGNTYLKLFIRIDNLEQLFKNYRLFTSIIDFKALELSQLKKDIAALELIKSELQQQYDKIHSLQQQQEQTVKEIENLKNEKLVMVRQINNDRENYSKMIDELEEEASNLTEMLSGKTPTRRMGVIDYAKVKGKLRWPVDGKVISFFGKKKSTRFDTYIINNGIEIQPARTNDVISIYSGEIIYQQYYKGYGNLIVIQHGRNLYTLYGHLEKLLKKTGDSVSEGEMIATVGDTGATSGKSLYFEIRAHLQPQDPLDWLKKKRK